MDRIRHGRWLGYIDNLAVYTSLGSLILCVYYCMSGNVHFGGAIIGILIGVLLSGFYLLNLWRSARKKRFLILAYKDKGKTMKVLFSVGILIGLIGGYLYGALKDIYPDIRIEGAVVAGMMFGMVTFSGLDLVGIYWLQHYYGYRFYIAKTEQEAEDIASRCSPEDEGSNTCEGKE
jgi:hypothetical protein